MMLSDGSIKEMRKVMAVLPDTAIHIVDGDEAPQYVEVINSPIIGHIVYQIGIRWLEQHYPEAFREVVTERLKRRKTWQKY